MYVAEPTLVTQRVTVHTLTATRQGRRVHLIDTPGFDDTRRKDSDILQEIAFWLEQARQRDYKIAGIIYVHSILTPRLQGSALQGLKVFKEMCGASTFSGVVLATSHWDAVHPQGQAWTRAVARQQELISNPSYFGDIMSNGGQALAILPNDQNTAFSVIDRVLARQNTLTLKLQRELIDEAKALRDTGAGMILFSRHEELLKFIGSKMDEITRELKDALRQQNQTLAAELQREFDQMKEDMAKQTKALQELRTSMRDVSLSQMRKAEEERVRLEQMMLETQADLRRLRNSPPQVKIIEMPALQQQQQVIRYVQNTSMASHSGGLTSQRIGAAAGIIGAGVGAMALCVVM
jgi:hypothetical protein